MTDDTANGPSVPVPPVAPTRRDRLSKLAEYLGIVLAAALAAWLGSRPVAIPTVPAALPAGRTIELTTPELRAAGVLGVGVVVPDAERDKPPARQSREECIAAVGRVQFGGGACSSQAVYPRRTDGRWDVLCAAHCVTAAGQRGRMRIKDGREFGVTVVAVNKPADAVWLRTDDVIERLPAVLLADDDAQAGDIVWQSGYGWNQPGVVKEGTCDGARQADGKQPFVISLSQGDSGGGFFRASDNRLVSVACCTTEIAKKALAFGPSVTAIKALRLTAASWDDWSPSPVPQCDPRGVMVGDGHRVVGIPQRMAPDSR